MHRYMCVDLDGINPILYPRRWAIVLPRLRRRASRTVNTCQLNAKYIRHSPQLDFLVSRLILFDLNAVADGTEV